MKGLTDAEHEIMKQYEEFYRQNSYQAILQRGPRICLDVIWLLMLIYRLEDDLRLLQAKERSL